MAWCGRLDHPSGSSWPRAGWARKYTDKEAQTLITGGSASGYHYTIYSKRLNQLQSATIGDSKRDMITAKAQLWKRRSKTMTRVNYSSFPLFYFCAERYRCTVWSDDGGCWIRLLSGVADKGFRGKMNSKQMLWGLCISRGVRTGLLSLPPPLIPGPLGSNPCPTSFKVVSIAAVNPPCRKRTW